MNFLFDSVVGENGCEEGVNVIVFLKMSFLFYSLPSFFGVKDVWLKDF